MMLTLVLLPGMDGTGDLFDPLLKELGDRLAFNVIRYPVNSRDGYSKLTEFVRLKLPSEGKFILLGESFSGPIAVTLAAELNPRLVGLILCCTFVSNPQPSIGVFQQILPLWVIELSSTKIMIRSMLGRFSNKAVCELIQKAIKSVPTKTFKSRMIAAMSVNVENELVATNVPILYLKASNDWFIPKSVPVRIKRLKTTVRIANIDGPHFLLQANPRGAAAEILNFASALQFTK